MTKAQEEALRQSVLDMKRAFTIVFKNETFPEASALVLKSLEKFCRFRESTFHPSERVHCLLEGRREVMLKIDDYLNKSVDEIVEDRKRKEALNVPSS